MNCVKCGNAFHQKYIPSYVEKDLAFDFEAQLAILRVKNEIGKVRRYMFNKALVAAKERREFGIIECIVCGEIVEIELGELVKETAPEDKPKRGRPKLKK